MSDKVEGTLRVRCLATRQGSAEGADGRNRRNRPWMGHPHRSGASATQALTQLDSGIDALRLRWGDLGHTVVLVMTEFGRTARMNGTRGTDPLRRRSLRCRRRRVWPGWWRTGPASVPGNCSRTGTCADHRSTVCGAGHSGRAPGLNGGTAVVFLAAAHPTTARAGRAPEPSGV